MCVRVCVLLRTCGRLRLPYHSSREGGVARVWTVEWLCARVCQNTPGSVRDTLHVQQQNTFLRTVSAAATLP